MGEKIKLTLPSKIDGRGEVRGYFFNKIKESEGAYIYEVNSDAGGLYYEVLRRVKLKRIYSAVYPKAYQFGVNAWTYFNLDVAVKKFSSL